MKENIIIEDLKFMYMSLKLNTGKGMEKTIKIFIGLILAPFLYARYSFMLFLPILFSKEMPYEAFFVFWFIYAVFFSFFMANCGLMKYLTMFLIGLFDIKYEVKGQWTSDMMHSFSVYSHPILSVNGKDYKLVIATMGGKTYDEDDNIRRKAILYHFIP